MANGFLPNEDDKEEEFSIENEAIPAATIHAFAADYFNLPYEEAIENLKKDYESNIWDDEEEAAKNFADASDSLNKFNEVTPETGINADFTETLQYIFDEYHTEEEKLRKIDETYENFLSSRYKDVKNTEDLISAKQYERELDGIRLFLRRGIVGKDVGRMKDMIARGAEAAISPFAGTADALFDTDYRKSLRDYVSDTTNPELDESIFSTGASIAGGIGGFMASALIPYGPTAYLGAMLTNQSKEVYDTALKETNDQVAAEDAMVASLPWNVTGTLGDNFLGVMASRVLKGTKGIASSVIREAAVGATLNVVQDYGVGSVLAKATDNPLFIPEEKELIQSAVAGGFIGGVIGAAGKLRNISPEKVQELKDSARLKTGELQVLKQKAKRTGQPEEIVEAAETAQGPAVFMQIADRMMGDTGPFEIEFSGFAGTPKPVFESEITGSLTEPNPPMISQQRTRWNKLGYNPNEIEAAMQYMTWGEQIEWEVFQKNKFKEVKAQQEADFKAKAPEREKEWVKNNPELTSSDILSEESRHKIWEMTDKKEPFTEDWAASEQDILDIRHKDGAGDLVEIRNTDAGYRTYSRERFFNARERFQLWRKTEKKRPFNSDWQPNAEEMTYLLANHPEEFTEITSQSRTAEAAEATTSEAKKKKEPEEKYSFTDLMPWDRKEDAVSFVLSSHVAKEAGVELAAKTMPWGTLGEASMSITKDLAGQTVTAQEINMNRAGYKNPLEMERAFSHEWSHSVDQRAAINDKRIKPDPNDPSKLSYETDPVLDKYTRIYEDYIQAGQTIDHGAFKAEVEALDIDWSPYNKAQSKSFTKYRATGTEIFANSMASILSEPGRVRDNYPTVWKAWKKAIEAHPDLKKLTNLVDKAKTDPTVLYKTFAGEQEAGQLAEARIVKKATEERIEERKEEKAGLLRKAFNWGRQAISTKFIPYDDVAKKQIKQGVPREVVHEQLTMLQDTTNKHVNMHILVDDPANNTMDELLSSVSSSDAETIKNLSNLLDITHVVNDTNSTIDDIKANPYDYKRAVKQIGEYLKDDTWYENIKDLEGEDLVVGLSTIQTKMNEPGRVKLQKAMAEDENAYAVRLLEKDAFDARRFMANPNVSYNSARPLLESFKNHVGETEWKAYDKALKGIHEIGYYVVNALDHAGLLDAKTKDKLVRNVETYATQNVIKYFEKDPRIRGSIRKAVGSLDLTGNALTSTIGKYKAIIYRSAFQETQNAAMRIIRNSDTPYREIKQKKKGYGKNKVYYESLFDTKTLLEHDNPKKSYFITAEEGKSHLWEVDDPSYAKAFGKGSFEQNGIIKAAANVSDTINKLFLARWGKTLGSLSFGLASKFRDITREALIAGSKEVNWTHWLGIPMHWGKKLRETRKGIRVEAKKFLLDKVISPRIQRALDYHGITWSLLREFGGLDDNVTFEHGIYNKLGVEIPREDNIFFSDRWNTKAIKLIRKLPFIENMEKMIQIDELTTKLMAFDIAEKTLKKGPWEAGRIMREWAGTPDPTGGGLEMSSLNKLFLFSRAHVNGMRALYDIMRDDPKKFGFQYAYRKLIPRMMLTSAFMGPVIGAMFGEKEEELYRKFLDKIPSYNKIGKSIIPLGFTDEDNNMRYFGVDPKEINANWKAFGIAIPIERDLIAVDQVNTPFFNAIEDLANTGTISFKKIAEDTVSAFGQVFGGNMSQGMQTPIHLAQLLYSNPKDYFRNRGILTKDVAEAGTLYQKFSEYMVWAMYNNYPAMFRRTQKRYSTEPTSFFDMIGRVPQLGAALKTFTMNTNYGDLEKSQEAKEQRKWIDSHLRMQMGENTKGIYNELSKYSGMASREGKAWKERVSTDTLNKVHVFNSWKSRVYSPALHALRDAYSAGDREEQERLLDALEDSSKSVLDMFKRD